MASLILASIPHMKPTVAGGGELVMGLPACLTPADWQVMCRARVKVMDRALWDNGQTKSLQPNGTGSESQSIYKLCGPGQFPSSS